MSKGVCDCHEPCACYAEGYAQGKDKAYFEMSNSIGPSRQKAASASLAVPSARS